MLKKDAEKIQKRNKREIEVHDMGMRVGIKASRIIMWILWGSNLIRRCLSKKIRFGYKSLLGRFISGFLLGVQPKWICCDDCYILGFDYKADKYGWKYYGGHGWLCANCRKDVEKV